MRAGWITCFIFASMLLAEPAPAVAQATQPVEQQVIRRDAAAAGTMPNAVGPSATHVALSLGAVLALIVGLFLVGRRFLPRGVFAQQGGGGGGAVQVLARTTIAPKQRIVLLQVGRRILVVADGGQNLTTLCEITDAGEAAALIAQLQSEKAGASFTAALNQATERFRTAENDPPREKRPDLESMREEIEGLARRVRGMAR